MRSQTLRWTVAAMALFLMLIGAIAALPAFATAPMQDTEGGKTSDKPQSCPYAWSVVDSPTIPDRDTYFSAVEAITDSDVWAAGYTSYTDTDVLYEHWDGSQWSVISAGTRFLSGSIQGLTHINANDVWAVGKYQPQGGYTTQTLTQHWDGSSWTTVPGRNVTTGGDNFLVSASSIATDDVWAVGYYYPELGSSISQTLIEHWDGSQWDIEPSPNITTTYRHILSGVAAVSTNDIWAVGRYRTDLSLLRTLIEHWNGSEWTIIPSPNVNEQHNLLNSVTVVSTNDVWAAGYYMNGGFYQTLIEHWDGVQWSVVPSPNGVTNNTNRLRSISALGANDIWAAGGYFDGYTSRTLTLHWNGVSWSLVASPNLSETSRLYDIDTLPTGEVWAAGDGYDGVGSEGNTLVLHYAETCSITTPTPTVTPAVTATPTPCTPGFNLISSPRASGSSTLNSVSALNPNDAWSVGLYIAENNQSMSLIEHWNGNQWTIVPNDGFGPGPNRLYGVSAYAANDVWAVGDVRSATSLTVTQTLIKHWDGAVWTNVTGPSPGNAVNLLSGVQAVAPDNVWAVGYYKNDSAMGEAERTLVLHWDGSQWSVVASPNSGTSNNRLNGVAVISADDIWAVGYRRDSVDNKQRTLTEHWDGQQWTVVTDPGPGSMEGYFQAVSGTSSTDVWAVGSYMQPSSHTLTAHWDGVGWNYVSSPNIGSYNGLTSVFAISANDVWATGMGRGPMILHWDGVRWGTAPVSNQPGQYQSFASVSASSAGDVWAVGYDGGNAFTLTQHYTGLCSCNVQFTDVSADNTFYSYVQCIACRNIVGGYACGGPGEPCDPQQNAYFRPGNPVTRGQLAKIVFLAANLVSYASPDQQSFEDVQPNSTFWLYAEALKGMGVITGYPCGGPGEPCIPPANRPYFRPNSSATRGQISQIVSRVVSYYDIIPTDRQTFEDVPPGSTFWHDIEELSLHEVISGYACGGPGEPCGPESRPYFRPGSNTTRGQMAKITSNTFFPNCLTRQKE